MDADHRPRRGSPGHRDRTAVRPGAAGEHSPGPGGYDAELRLHNEVLREALAAHLSGDGVWLDSRAWIVSARRC
jgi:hypothetical protein